MAALGNLHTMVKKTKGWLQRKSFVPDNIQTIAAHRVHRTGSASRARSSLQGTKQLGEPTTGEMLGHSPGLGSLRRAVDSTGRALE